MKMKNIICILLAAFLVISLSGCIAKSVPSGTNAEGRFVYAVVRSSNLSNTMIEDAAKNVRNTIKDNFGIYITYLKDEAVEDYDNNYEILIGDTNREESAEALKRLADNRDNYHNDFIVAVIDDKICINSTNPSVLSDACDWFLANFCESLETWALLKADYEFIYEHENSVSLINKCADTDIGVFSLVLPRHASFLYGIIAEEIVDMHIQNGYPMPYIEDFDAEAEYEIQIGDCDREASKSVKVEGNNFVIKVIGKKIVIKGGNDLATREGTIRFRDELLKANESGTPLSWSDGYTINGKYDSSKKDSYSLNWNDEFDSATMDLNKWGDYNHGDTSEASSIGGTAYWQNVYGETLYKGDDMGDLIYPSDGNLHLVTKRLGEKDFGGALISTYTTMLYRYGIIEIRANVADVPASVSLWQNGGSIEDEDFVKSWGKSQVRAAMTEYDIFEDYGQTDYFTSTIHKWWSRTTETGGYAAGGHQSLASDTRYHTDDNNTTVYYDTAKYGDTLDADFHIFSLYWDGTKVMYAFDGKSHLEYKFIDNDSASLFGLMDYVIMSCRMGLTSYGAAYRASVHPPMTEALIDYVRIYQREDQNAQLLTAWDDGIMYPNNPTGMSY